MASDNVSVKISPENIIYTGRVDSILRLLKERSASFDEQTVGRFLRSDKRLAELSRGSEVNIAVARYSHKDRTHPPAIAPNSPARKGPPNIKIRSIPPNEKHPPKNCVIINGVRYENTDANTLHGQLIRLSEGLIAPLLNMLKLRKLNVQNHYEFTVTRKTKDNRDASEQTPVSYIIFDSFETQLDECIRALKEDQRRYEEDINRIKTEHYQNCIKTKARSRRLSYTSDEDDDFSYSWNQRRYSDTALHRERRQHRLRENIEESTHKILGDKADTYAKGTVGGALKNTITEYVKCALNKGETKDVNINPTDGCSQKSKEIFYDVDLPSSQTRRINANSNDDPQNTNEIPTLADVESTQTSDVTVKPAGNNYVMQKMATEKLHTSEPVEVLSTKSLRDVRDITATPPSSQCAESKVTPQQLEEMKEIEEAVKNKKPYFSENDYEYVIVDNCPKLPIPRAFYDRLETIQKDVARPVKRSTPKQPEKKVRPDTQEKNLSEWPSYCKGINSVKIVDKFGRVVEDPRHRQQYNEYRIHMNRTFPQWNPSNQKYVKIPNFKLARFYRPEPSIPLGKKLSRKITDLSKDTLTTDRHPYASNSDESIEDTGNGENQWHEQQPETSWGTRRNDFLPVGNERNYGESSVRSNIPDKRNEDYRTGSSQPVRFFTLEQRNVGYRTGSPQPGTSRGNERNYGETSVRCYTFDERNGGYRMRSPQPGSSRGNERSYDEPSVKSNIPKQRTEGSPQPETSRGNERSYGEPSDRSYTSDERNGEYRTGSTQPGTSQRSERNYRDSSVRSSTLEQRHEGYRTGSPQPGTSRGNERNYGEPSVWFYTSVERNGGYRMSSPQPGSSRGNERSYDEPSVKSNIPKQRTEESPQPETSRGSERNYGEPSVRSYTSDGRNGGYRTGSPQPGTSRGNERYYGEPSVRSYTSDERNGGYRTGSPQPGTSRGNERNYGESSVKSNIPKQRTEESPQPETSRVNERIGDVPVVRSYSPKQRNVEEVRIVPSQPRTSRATVLLSRPAVQSSIEGSRQVERNLIQSGSSREIMLQPEPAVKSEQNTAAQADMVCNQSIGMEAICLSSTSCIAKESVHSLSEVYDSSSSGQAITEASVHEIYPKSSTTVPLTDKGSKFCENCKEKRKLFVLFCNSHSEVPLVVAKRRNCDHCTYHRFCTCTKIDLSDTE